MSTDFIFYSLATLFSLLTGIAYITSFVRMAGARGFLAHFTASFFRVVIGVIFVVMLLRLPPLLGILMVILCVGAAGVTLRYIRPA